MINDELAMMDSVERGEWQSINHLNEVKKALMQATTETALKDTQVSKLRAKGDATGQMVEK